MRPDLESLEISKGELKHLSGVDTEDVFRPVSLQNEKTRFSYFLQEFLIGVALTPLVVGFLYIFIIGPIMGRSLAVAIASLILTPIAIVSARWYWFQRYSHHTLISLLDEVDRFHAVLKAIDISDRLDSASSQETTLSDRTTVIEALTLTRNDLIRALKTERILRDNKDFISTNPELFANNLTALKALQVSDRASEYGQFLDRALQIGIGIQSEMRKLRSSRGNET